MACSVHFVCLAFRKMHSLIIASQQVKYCVVFFFLNASKHLSNVICSPCHYKGKDVLTDQLMKYLIITVSYQTTASLKVYEFESK